MFVSPARVSSLNSGDLFSMLLKLCIAMTYLLGLVRIASKADFHWSRCTWMVLK